MSTVTIEFQGVDSEDFRLDAASITVPEEGENAAKGLIQNLYDAASTIEGLRGQIEGLEGERDTLQESQDESLSPERLDSLVRERKDIMDVAVGVGFKEDDLKGAANEDIVRAVVSTRTTIKEDASEEYVQGCFNMIADGIGKAAEKAASNRSKFQQLADNASGRRFDEDNKTDEEDNGLSYRELAAQRLDGLHLKSDKDLRGVATAS